MKSLLRRQNQRAKMALLLLPVFISAGLHAQKNASVTGTITDEKNNQPIPYATVCLMTISDDAIRFSSGTITGESGCFTIDPVYIGKYQLRVTSEIPTSESIVYSFPTYSLNYSFRKINLYTSYNGEINFENIDETTYRNFRCNSSEIQLSSVQQVRQKNLSHKFHFGFDYDLTSRDLISLYGSYNPYSYEQDGKVITEITGSESRTWNTQRDETDKSRLCIFGHISACHPEKQHSGSYFL